MKLLLNWPPVPRRLLLKSAEGSKVSLSVGYLLHAGYTESADQLVLQVFDAHVEPEPLHIGASEVGAEAGAFETAPELALLCGVTEARKSDVESLWPEQIQEAFDCLRTADGHNGNALGVEISTAPLGERLERAFVADPFDEDDRTRVDVRRRRVRCGN